MAHITLNTGKLRHNFGVLQSFFKENKIQWSAVTKILCGHKRYLEVLLQMDMKHFSDSRISNLKTIKALNPDAVTIYIKPPAKGVIPEVVKYADISLNSDIYTIKLLSEEAVKQGKKHQVIIMIDLGELREGVMREDFLRFYEEVFQLENIDVIGLGTNLSCLYGILPNSDKLIQLSLYKQLVEEKFNKKIPLISGGSSVTIPLIENSLLPRGINHFRIGETLFMGTNAYDQSDYSSLEQNVFVLYAEIIELYEKPIVPSGELGTNLEGDAFTFNKEDIGKTSNRALIDIGLLDVDIKHLQPADDKIIIAGATSDMIVLDLGDNTQNYRVGCLVELQLDYMGIVRIMNSKYIEKRVM